MIEIKIAGNTAAEALADLTKLADLVRSGMMLPVGQQKSEPLSRLRRIILRRSRPTVPPIPQNPLVLTRARKCVPKP